MSWQSSPHLTVVFDLAPDKGTFLPSMNFWRTSYAGDGDRDNIELYIGRHFLNIPFVESGYCMLAEMQTISDLREGGWEIWIGPEFGEVLKPGFGVDVEPDQRTWSFELGYRHFF